MMYYCRTCKEYFSEPEDRKETVWHDEVDTMRVEEYTVSVCPYCHDDDVTKVNDCQKCGNGCNENGNYFCDDCHNDLEYWLNKIRDDMKISSSDLEDLIAEHFGW